MTLQELWKEGNQILSEAGIPEARLDARYLLEWASGQDHSFLLLHPEHTVAEEVVQSYRNAIRQRCHHMPLQYITGEQEFMGLSFRVNESVLIPRQDTELLVETVLEHLHRQPAKPVRILDMCCGSGCIGLSLWLLAEGNRDQMRMAELKKPGGEPYPVVLADVSPEALQVARENATRLHADVSIVESDIWNHISGRYGIIVSNPPYIPSHVVDTLMPEVQQYEPRLALDGAEDGLSFYRRIIEQADGYLEEDGYVFFEIGFDQADDVRQILVGAGFEEVTVKQDLAGLDRVIYARKGREM